MTRRSDPLACPQCGQVHGAARMEKAFDGREVCNYSDEWRDECEARHVLRLPTKSDRYGYLHRVQAKRGEAARHALAALVMAVWRAGRTTGQDDS